MSTTSHASAAEHAGGARPAEYVVVARRYRPQTFEELVGQEHVARALSGAITSGRVGHAYLFTGARGVGKTSAARILAKALDCVQGPTPQPCNQCDICASISSGDDVDVLEIDGASNRGIDEIRELRQKVNVRPSRSRFKVYIIDEVHMLTREAFNALLKTLEEPPEHVKFIFCTTEAEKIPITILSRCQRFDFAGIQTPSIVERLRQIVAAEGVTAEPEALEILARRATGSMRDSQSLLEQLLAFGGPQITVADVHRMLGTAADGRLAPLAGYLIDHNAAAALAELDAAIAEGVDVGQLLDQLLGYFRDLMVAAVGGPADSFLHVSPADRAQVAATAAGMGIETILAVLQILDQTMSRLRYSTHARTLAELALVRICKLEDLDQLSDLIERVHQGQPLTAPAAGQRTLPPPLATAAKKKADELEVPPGRPREDEPAASAEPQSMLAGPVGQVSAEPSSPACPAASATLLNDENAANVWQQVLQQLSDMTSANASMCDHVAICAPNRLVLRFRAKYTSCKTFCERPEQVAKLEKALAAVTGGLVKVEFALLDDLPEEKAVEQSRSRPASNRDRLQEKSQHPMVRRAIELFDARPVRLEEPPV